MCVCVSVCVCQCVCVYWHNTCTVGGSLTSKQCVVKTFTSTSVYMCMGVCVCVCVCVHNEWEGPITSKLC